MIAMPVTHPTAAASVTTSSMHPRPYLSYSQLRLWENDPNEYIRQYLRGEKKQTNGAMDFGSWIHSALENQNHLNDPELEHLLMVMPAYTFREREIAGTLGGVLVFGKVDGFEEEPVVIGEYKTGAKWTQSRVDKDDQLTFYSGIVYSESKSIPEIRLHWIPTSRDCFGRFSISGEVVTFTTVRTLTDILRLSARITKAWREIAESMSEEDKKLGL